MSAKIDYVATLSGVREVSLLGDADLGYWQERLRPHGVKPLAERGCARILVIAADGRFKGIRFQELSFSVLVEADAEVGRGPGAFLVQAFSSRRFFAWVERACFKTPYLHAEVSLSAAVPAYLSLAWEKKIVFRAEMVETAADTARQPLQQSDDGWSGPVFLPGAAKTLPGNRRWFLAHIQGFTQSFRFSAEHDRMILAPTPAVPVLGSLAESQFVPTEWLLRANSVHAKSKTYRRTATIGAGQGGATV